MGALVEQGEADYVVEEVHSCMTADHEDHTFSGIIFAVECHCLQVATLTLRSIWVRGELGPMTVWVKDGFWDAMSRETQQEWHLVHSSLQPPSLASPRQLVLNPPTDFRPGDVASVYVHSALRSDTGIVYDNQRDPSQDSYLRVHAGCAHLSPHPFASHHPWGAWRPRRQFVGKITYGVRKLLWRPAVHARFPRGFRTIIMHLCLLKKRRPLSALPDDVFFYVIHLCKADDWPNAHRDGRAPQLTLGSYVRGVWFRLFPSSMAG